VLLFEAFYYPKLLTMWVKQSIHEMVYYSAGPDIKHGHRTFNYNFDATGQRGMQKPLTKSSSPVGSEVRIARDFMLAGQGGVRINGASIRGQASTAIIITHRMKVAGIVCV